MSINENDSIYNSSSNEGEIEAIPIPSSLPSNSSPPLSDMIRQSIIFLQQKHFGEVGLVGSPEEPELELGLDLGRRLAQLELGNELNKGQLDRIKQLSQINQETLVLENSRIDDLEGKVISMEARLLSEEKQGFDTKEKLENLEKKLKMKNKEILVLREIIDNQMTNQATQEKRFCILEKGNCELTSQFVTLLETCEAFNEELLLLKKMNFELKKELDKKGNTTVTGSNVTFPSKLNPITGSHSTHSVPNCPTREIQNSHQINSSQQEGTAKTEAKGKVNCVTPKSYYSHEFVPQGYPNFYYSESGDIYSAPSGSVYSAPNEPIYSAPSGSVSYPPPDQDPQSMVIFDTGPASQGAGLEAYQNSINTDFNGYYYQ